MTIKFTQTDEIKLSIVGSASKTKIDSGDDLLIEVEFDSTVSCQKDNIDRRYEICINVIDASTTFFIPVIVLSSNPVVNFPKEISLPDTAVNTPCYSNIFVLNCTSQQQKFSYESLNDMKVIPDCKNVGLKPSEAASILIEFVPKEVGNFIEKIQISYGAGKKTSIILKCCVVPVNIFLSKFLSFCDLRKFYLFVF